MLKTKDKKNNNVKYNGLEITWDNLEKFYDMFLKKETTLKDNPGDESIINSLREIYRIMYAIRQIIKKSYNSSSIIRKQMAEKAREDPVFWINAFAVTYRPENKELGIPTDFPLILPRETII